MRKVGKKDRIYQGYQKKLAIILFYDESFLSLHSQSRNDCAKSRSGAVVARWAHNPKVVSSSLASATIKKVSKRIPFFCFHTSQTCDTGSGNYSAIRYWGVTMFSTSL